MDVLITEFIGKRRRSGSLEVANGGRVDLFDIRPIVKKGVFIWPHKNHPLTHNFFKKGISKKSITFGLQNLQTFSRNYSGLDRTDILESGACPD